MIKKLINDIVFDNIKLSQALTQSKIIANKIQNENFKNWLKKELEGYSFNDPYLPKYRKIFSPIFLTAELPFGRIHKFPVVMPDNSKDIVTDMLNFHRAIEPISIVEEQVKTLKSNKGVIKIPPQQVEMLSKLYQSQLDEENGVIRSGSRDVSKAQYQNIIELTKQSLLDTLIELEREFPNLLNEYTMSKENNEKVHNIITNNIYGSNNPTNIAAGQNVEQVINSISLSEKDFERLKELGVEEERIDELKQIITVNSKDKISLKSKAIKWLGSVSAAVAARGLYDSIPAITEILGKLI